MDDENDDQWLYGDGDNQENSSSIPDPNPEDGKNNETEQEAEPETPSEDQQLQDDTAPPDIDDESKNDSQNDETEDGELQQNGEGSDKEDLEDDDSDDDDVNVVIGDIKSTTTSYTQQLNIKRGGLTTTIGDKNKAIQQSGKFNVEEFEQIGTINGVTSVDYNLDSLEDKPWRKPGADITDYFNYGFNEDTWKAYCERQKRIRVNDSGVGLMPLNAIGLPRGPMPVINDNSKYSGNYQGSNTQRPAVSQNKINEVPKINTIQVMTADRREYSRKPGAGFPDMSMPPPSGFGDFQPDYGFNPEPEPFYGGYEPTQDSQWSEGGNPNWAPSEIKTLTGGPPMGPPSHGMPPPGMMHSPGRHSPSRERDRAESRARSEKPRERVDRERERSHRRERSRSRSRRHRSRSRSPGHRSHKKKKSRRHEDSE